MKCKVCGINYDDDDKECPMCGAKSGTGKSHLRPYTTNQTLPTDSHEKKYFKPHTYQTFTQKTKTVKTSLADFDNQAGQARPATGAKRFGILILILVLLGNLAPILRSFDINSFEAIKHKIASGVSDFGGTGTPEQAPHNSFLTGTWKSDSGERFEFSEDDSFDYSVSDKSYARGTYTLSWNDPEESDANPDYPFEQYDSYLLWLNLQTMVWDGTDYAKEIAGDPTRCYSLYREKGTESSFILYDFNDGQPVKFNQQ